MFLILEHHKLQYFFLNQGASGCLHCFSPFWKIFEMKNNKICSVSSQFISKMQWHWIIIFSTCSSSDSFFFFLKEDTKCVPPFLFFFSYVTSKYQNKFLFSPTQLNFFPSLCICAACITSKIHSKFASNVKLGYTKLYVQGRAIITCDDSSNNSLLCPSRENSHQKQTI